MNDALSVLLIGQRLYRTSWVKLIWLNCAFVLVIIGSMVFFWPKSRSDSLTLIRPTPEYSPVDVGLLSSHLFGENTGGYEVAAGVLKAGVRLIILQADPSDTQTMLESLIQHVGERYRSKIDVVMASHDSFWIRDFGPIALDLQRQDSPPQMAFGDFTFRENERLEDSMPYQLGLQGGQTVIGVPLTLDGGNFLTNGEWCLMADSVVEPISNPQPIAKILQSHLGCAQTLMIKNPAHEHIDMWAKFVNKDTLLVNQISEKLLALTDDEEDRQHLQLMRQHLDEAAETLAQYFTIKRLPMLLPFGESFRTYTNSLLINQNVLVPRYQKNYMGSQAYIDDAFIPSTEAAVTRIYQQSGYQVIWVNADYFIANGGGIHCVSLALSGFGNNSSEAVPPHILTNMSAKSSQRL